MLPAQPRLQSRGDRTGSGATVAHCPWINGKAERFNQTLAYEWAYARVFDSSTQRVNSLPDWLHGYNHHRPHTALAGKPPVSRVTNVPRFDI